MITQLDSQLYTISVPLPGNPLKNLNVYVVRDPGGRNLLIDTGFRQDACRQALLEGLQELGIRMEDTDIFLTHLHSDHTGLAPELASAATEVYIGEHDLGYMPGSSSAFSWAASDRHYAREGFPEALLRRLTTENPAQGLAPVPFSRYRSVQHGQHFRCGPYDFTALHTPGHTPGHTMLWEEKTGIALLGDHILFDITPNITRWQQGGDALGDYLQSVAAADRLPVKLPLPAHRQVHMDYHQRCAQLLLHHQRRCDEVLEILSDGRPMNAWEIASRMTWKIRARSWEEFPAPQKWFAVGEAMAHIDHLIAQGSLLREARPDGSVFYRINSDTPQEVPES